MRLVVVVLIAAAVGYIAGAIVEDWWHRHDLDVRLPVDPFDEPGGGWQS